MIVWLRVPGKVLEHWPGSEQITVTEVGAQQYTLHCTGDKGTTVSTVNVNVIAQNIDAWSGTKIPSYLPPSPNDFELFDNSDGLKYRRRS